ncbi:gap junction epsilon-1 protein isoform X4 [Salvelinus fontinalis]|uniref:gap junction epsilon-1 protein isoform X4 n=1 Tax=Salvelinus fontinalis TaxID=8038 RepID=UPI002484F52C|nr:gap junction epsilon-1 protein isoform X4 [Salvelinus fontinalis]
MTEKEVTPVLRVMCSIVNATHILFHRAGLSLGVQEWHERRTQALIERGNEQHSAWITLRPPTVIGQFHTLFFGSVRMFFLGVLGFAVYGNEALHFSCDPDRRELNLYCYNQFRPITPQVSHGHQGRKLHTSAFFCWESTLRHFFP